jgi:nucleoside-diphosphate-sugar epimerase
MSLYTDLKLKYLVMLKISKMKEVSSMSQHETRSVLLLGGGGLVGTHLARELAQQGHRVTIFDDFSARVRSTDIARAENIAMIKYLQSTYAIPVIEGDVRNVDDIRKILDTSCPDVIGYFAALLDNETALYCDRAYQVHVRSLGDLLLQLDTLNARPRLVTVSSSFVYGHFRQETVAEDHPLVPTTEYGRFKVAAEQVVQALCPFLDIPYVIVRPSAIYGPGDGRPRYTSLMISRAIQGEPVELNRKLGNYKVDFTYIADAVNFFCSAFFHPAAENQIFNLSSQQIHTYQTFMECKVRLSSRQVYGLKTGIPLRHFSVSHQLPDPV